MYRKLFGVICLALLLLSVYKDVTKGIIPIQKKEINEQSTTHFYDFRVVRVKFNHGETVLSISEMINNNHIQETNIEKMLTHFKNLNPGVNPYKLKVGQYYYFPLYYAD